MRASITANNIHKTFTTGSVPIHVLKGLSMEIYPSEMTLIIGPSGSGKSFFTNHMMRQNFEQGAHVLLVDTGNSYKGLCTLMGGVYFTYEENDPISFNPFIISGALDVEKKESIKSLLQALWKKDDESVSQSEYVSIGNAVSQYYALLDISPEIKPSFNTFYEFVKGPYAAALIEENVREKEFDIDNFLYVLKPYYIGGEYDFFGAFTPPCPDPDKQTIIDGECKDSFVDSESLPDFDTGLVGDSNDKGSCFDVPKCFAAALTVTEAYGRSVR